MRWILSHQRRNPHVAGFLIGSIVMVVLNSAIPGLVGRAFDAVLGVEPDSSRVLTTIALVLLLIVVARSGLGFPRPALYRGAGEADRAGHPRRAVRQPARQEPSIPQPAAGRRPDGPRRQRRYASSAPCSAPASTCWSTRSARASCRSSSSCLEPRLLAAPLVFAVAFVWSIRRFCGQLSPVSADVEDFGTLNAGLNEAVRGIEVVKATARRTRRAATSRSTPGGTATRSSSRV